MNINSLGEQEKVIERDFFWDRKSVTMEGKKS